jgi:D-alanyl-D-alanine carboxypeptidase
MYNYPFNGNSINININMGGYPGSQIAGFGMNDSSGAMMMQLMQMFMVVTAQMMAFMTAQQGGVASGAMPGFGGGGGQAGTPGLGNFLGQGSGGSQGGGAHRGMSGGRGGQQAGTPAAKSGGDHGHVGEKTGNLVDLGGGKKVDSSIAGNVRAMIAAAKKDGIDLKITSAHRSHAEQKVLYDKYKNGTGNLAAKPGTSNHESGQAIDFTNTPGAHAWLAKNAGRFGLKNLPGEPWHYSTTGR